MTGTTRNTILGITLVAIVAVSWSTAGLFTRVVTTDFPTTLFWRSIFGGLVVLMTYAVMKRPKTLASIIQFNRGEVVLAGVSAVAMCCFISAFFYTSIANVSFVYGTSPLVTVLLAWMLLRDRPKMITMLAVVMSGLGVGMLAWGGQNFNDIVGLLLAGGMTVLMASIAVLVKYFPRADAGKAAYLSAGFAAVLMAPFVTSFALDGHNMFWLALYGLVNVGIGFGLYLIGVARITPATAALVGLLEVPLAPIWAAWLFDEAMTLNIIIGGVFIITAAVVHIRATDG